jgi:hypothetical protein
MLTAPRDLNALIFDYMVVEGFSDAAVEFARETGISSTIDQDAIQERMEIRQAVADGRVEEAVRRVNELDPEVSNLSSLCLDGPKDMKHHAPLSAGFAQGHAEIPDSQT